MKWSGEKSQNWNELKTKGHIGHLVSTGPPRIKYQVNVPDHNARSSFRLSFEVKASFRWIKSCCYPCKINFLRCLVVDCYAFGTHQDTWPHLRIKCVGHEHNPRESRAHLSSLTLRNVSFSCSPLITHLNFSYQYVRVFLRNSPSCHNKVTLKRTFWQPT